MRKHKEHEIKRIIPGSIAEELELEPGDFVLQINGKWLEDVFDYHYLILDEQILLLIRKADGEEWELDIEKDMEEDLGIVFENGLMDEYRSCHNKCIFCFIDQMPPGMRDTLYFKDDDSRLSFLQGNYVTLTNLSDEDLDRIIRLHMAPINISVQTSNPELRNKMLKNRFAGKALEKIKVLYDHGIEMNSQIVLCKGINDGEELERTIRDMSAYLPYMQSLSVVPVGLSKFRDGLFPLEPFEKEDARKVIAQIESWQKKLYEKWGTHFVQASDEWYLTADLPLPEADRYDGFGQLENGVGMIRLFLQEVEEALDLEEGDEEYREVSLGTGLLMEPILKDIAEKMKGKFPNLTVHVYGIRNDFFGENITVSGLVTGQDILKQLKNKALGERLLLPINMFRSGEEVFLDDVTRTQVEQTLQVPVVIVKSDGNNLISRMLGREEELEGPCLYQGYESTDEDFGEEYFDEEYEENFDEDEMETFDEEETESFDEDFR